MPLPPPPSPPLSTSPSLPPRRVRCNRFDRQAEDDVDKVRKKKWKKEEVQRIGCDQNKQPKPFTCFFPFTIRFIFCDYLLCARLGRAVRASIVHHSKRREMPEQATSLSLSLSFSAPMLDHTRRSFSPVLLHRRRHSHTLNWYLLKCFFFAITFLLFTFFFSLCIERVDRCNSSKSILHGSPPFWLHHHLLRKEHNKSFIRNERTNERTTTTTAAKFTRDMKTINNHQKSFFHGAIYTQKSQVNQSICNKKERSEATVQQTNCHKEKRMQCMCVCVRTIACTI